MKYRTAALLAFHDMKPMIDELKADKNYPRFTGSFHRWSSNDPQYLNEFDNYVCTEAYFHTIESRRMNRELGINRINYLGNTNG